MPFDIAVCRWVQRAVTRQPIKWCRHSSQANQDRGASHERLVTPIQPIVACRHAPEVFDAIEKTLNKIAGFVEVFLALSRHRTGFPRASTMAWIFVLTLPRQRPMAWTPFLWVQQYFPTVYSFWLVPTLQRGNALVAAPAANVSWRWSVWTCLPVRPCTQTGSYAGAWEPACLFRGDTSATKPFSIR